MQGLCKNAYRSIMFAMSDFAELHELAAAIGNKTPTIKAVIAEPRSFFTSRLCDSM